MSGTFETLVKNERIKVELNNLGFVTPTEVQAQVLPLLAGQAHMDLHVQAQTGTGKTLSFGLPLLERINSEEKYVQGLVIAPTRELATQIFESLKPFSRALGIEVAVIYGGMSISDQIARLRRGIHIVIGTPGRLNDHLSRGTLDLSRLKTLVLDEADVMFDMGFKTEVEQMLTYVNNDSERWLFAATVKSSLDDFIRNYMRSPKVLLISKNQVSGEGIAQYYCMVPFSHRLSILARLIDLSEKDFYGFVFCQTKILTAEVADDLVRRGYRVGALHGDMSQDQRNMVIKKFRERKLQILVATDVAARGIDVPDLTHVVNFSVPEDYETYIHRIGRTGRAGKTGIAITLVGKSEMSDLKAIERKYNLKINKLEAPTKEEVVGARMARIAEFCTQSIEIEKLEFASFLSQELAKYDAHNIMQVAIKLLHEKFFSDLLHEKDVPVNKESTRGRAEENVTEVAINIGTDDGVSADAIRTHILAYVSQEEVKKIRATRRKTFVEVTNESLNKFLNGIKDTSLEGRVLNAYVVQNNFRDGGRSSGGGRRGNDYAGRGRRESSGFGNRESSGFGSREGRYKKNSERSGYGRDFSRDGEKSDFNRSGNSSTYSKDEYRPYKSRSNDFTQKRRDHDNFNSYERKDRSFKKNTRSYDERSQKGDSFFELDL